MNTTSSTRGKTTVPISVFYHFCMRFVFFFFLQSVVMGQGLKKGSAAQQNLALSAELKAKILTRSTSAGSRELVVARC